MRLMICALILLAGCAEAERTAEQKPAIEVAGYLESKSLDEASGLAHSIVRADLLWAINDEGAAALYAMDMAGNKLGKVRINDAKNRDWEDLASFELDGTPFLLAADIGDNQAQRKDVTLYVVAEPKPDDDEVDIAWKIEFTYPEGPRDAESLAVDVAAGKIFVLSKRDIPARLYSLPLRPETDERIIAQYLGTVATLPQPSQRDLNNALANKDWYWQPTGMDFSSAGNAALLLTYRGVYYFARQAGESWATAMQRAPMGAPLGKHNNAEAIAFAGDGMTAFVTTEGKHAPLLRINLSGANDP